MPVVGAYDMVKISMLYKRAAITGDYVSEHLNASVESICVHKEHEQVQYHKRQSARQCQIDTCKVEERPCPTGVRSSRCP